VSQAKTPKVECSVPPSEPVLWKVTTPETLGIRSSMVRYIRAKLWIEARNEAERLFPHIPREHFEIVLHTEKV